MLQEEYTMTENFAGSWEKFEHSGRVSDYLEYKGINYKSCSGIKGELFEDNGKGTGNSLPGCK